MWTRYIPSFIAEDGGEIGIFDATNSTRARRAMIHVHAHAKMSRRQLQVIFVESMCADPKVLEVNLRQKVRHSPDYVGMSEEAALEDLRSRITNYERVYETVDERLEPDVAYIKVIDLREKIVCYRISGARAQAIVAFLMAVHVVHRPIWLVRAGHCVDTPLDDGRVVDETPVPSAVTDDVAASATGHPAHVAIPPSLPESGHHAEASSPPPQPQHQASVSRGISTQADDPQSMHALEEDRRDRLLAPSPSMSPYLGGANQVITVPPEGMASSRGYEEDQEGRERAPSSSSSGFELTGSAFTGREHSQDEETGAQVKLQPAESGAGTPLKFPVPRGRSADPSTAAMQISQLGGAFSEALASLIYTRCLEFGSSMRRNAMDRQSSADSRGDDAASARGTHASAEGSAGG